MQMNTGKTALLVGATGLTGRHLLKLLLQNEAYQKVTTLVRNKMDVTHTKFQQLQVDFDHLQNYRSHFRADDIFCCLGTTIKKAGSQEQFKKVDHDYPLQLARIGKSEGVKTFVIITSLGATANSRNFYLQTKGKLEQALMALDFEHLIVVRPSLLLGNRPEFRFLEVFGQKAMQLLSFLFIGPLKKYQAIEAEKVAWSMVYFAKHASERVRIVESDELQKLNN